MSRKTYSKKFKNSNYGSNYPANLELAVEMKFQAPANQQNNKQKGFVCLIYKAFTRIKNAFKKADKSKIHSDFLVIFSNVSFTDSVVFQHLLLLF